MNMVNLKCKECDSLNIGAMRVLLDGNTNAVFCDIQCRSIFLKRKNKKANLPQVESCVKTEEAIKEKECFYCRKVTDRLGPYYVGSFQKQRVELFCDHSCHASFAMRGEGADNPLDTQVGGDHYKKYAIQPTEYIHKNNLNFCQGNVVKYTTRYRDKNGIEDLKKAKHYIELLIELEYGEKNG